jgi:hypothetical protein
LAIAQVDLERGLVGYYDFDKVEADTFVVNKASGTDVMPNGIIRNEPVWTDGISGNAFLYSPSSKGHVAFGTYDPSAGTDAFSVSVWVNWKGLDGNWHSICGKRDGWDPTLIMWDICLDMNNGRIQFEANTSNGKVFLITTDPPFIDDWTHVVVTFELGWATIYMNGEFVVEGDLTLGLKRDAEFHLGCGTTGGGDPFNGVIDEFRVYNRVLSSDEVAALFKLPTSVDQNIATPISNFTLYQNYPNPFNPSTQISYSIAKSEHVTLKVFDLLGKDVAVLFDGIRQAGQYKVTFDGAALASGVYFYQLQSGNFIETKKLLLMK